MNNYDLLLAAGNTQKKFTNSSNKRATPTNAATSYRSVLQESIANVLRPPVRNMNNASSTNSQVLRGDANDDGVVDKNDLDLLQMHVTELRSVKNFKAADMDGNGKITITDVCQLSLMLQEQEKSAKGIKGDANDDGVVDKKDRELIVQRMFDDMDGVRSSVKVNMDNIDFSGDGKITLEDYAEFLRIYNEQQPKSKQILKGDANGDGKVNQRDLDLISSRAVNANTGEKFDMTAADMNDDGEIDNIDEFKVRQLVKEYEAHFNTLQGDSNGDGVVDERDYQNIDGYLSDKDSSEDFIMKNSDVNGDGVVDRKDLQGVRNILDGRPVDWDESKRLLGDVNGDGKIDVVNDVATIINHLNGKIQKKDFYWDNADVNHDGKIDLVDAKRIEKFYNGVISSLDQEITKIAPPFEKAVITQQSGAYYDLYLTSQMDKIAVDTQVRVTGMSSDGTALEVVFPTSDGGEAIGWISIENVEKFEEPQPPPDPIINYPYEARYDGNRAIWVYTDENLTNHSGNDVVLPGKIFNVLGENDKAFHISYTNSQGIVLDRWFPKNYPAQYQAWTAIATSDIPAFTDENLNNRIGNEAVYKNDMITVLDERDNSYLVEYPTKDGSKTRWIRKTDVVPYEEPIIPLKPEHVSDRGIALIKEFERFKEEAYKPYETEKYYTIGYGHTGPDVTEGMKITREQAEEYLRQDLIKAENLVKKYCSHFNLNQNQFDALVSFTFNCGEGNLKKLLHGESGTENRSLEELPEHMPYYRKAGGVISQGLVRRRAAEVKLFNTPVESVTPTPAPVIDPIEQNVIERLDSYINGSMGNYWKIDTKWTGGYQCRGFAQQLYSKIFRVGSITGYANNNYSALNFPGSYEAGKLFDFGEYDTDFVKKLFIEKARSGAFVQMGRRYSLNSDGTAPNPHSAIVHKIDDDGVWFYEANAGGTGMITYKKYTWKELAEKNKGFTLYLPNNYQ